MLYFTILKIEGFEMKKVIEIYEVTRIYGEYDDTNMQNTEVFADGELILEYNPKNYPPFSYGGGIEVDNSKSFKKLMIAPCDCDGEFYTLFPPHGAKLVINNDKCKTYYE